MTERRETPTDDDLASGRVRIVEKISFDSGRIQLRVDGSTKTGMILVRPGDLVVSGINAAKGAIAIYDANAVAPVAATIHYGAYEINHQRADVRFLWWMLRSHFFQDLLLEFVPGGIKTELKAKRLLPVPVPLPPLAEQRRVVARIEELAAQIHEARTLRHQATEEAEALSRSGAEAVFQKVRTKLGTKILGDVCSTITDGDHNTPQFSDEGARFIFVGNVSSGRLHFENTKRVSLDYFRSLKSHRLPERGDILYSAVGATLGIPAVVDSDEPFCFQRHVAILKPDRNKVDSRFVWHMLGSRTVTEKAWASTTGSAQPTIPLRAIRELPIPVPPLAEQRQIVAELDALQAEVDALKRLQAETAAELDALLPAILDRAFKGEL
ncbi:MAG: restriction endonuclease subunit S [Verrucomicrobiota bacterium]